MRILIKIKPQEERLDKWVITQIKDISRSHVRKLIDNGNIKVNSHIVDPDYELRKDDRVDINLPAPAPHELKGENIPLKIVYEDNDLIVIDKPAGLVVHPTAGHPTGTLVNGLLYHWQNLPQLGESLRPGIVHRLDKDTSGLIVVAKTEQSLESLQQQFKKHKIIKTYLGLVKGHMNPKDGTIQAGITRHPKNPMRFTVSREGKDASTTYRTLLEKKDYAYLELTPKTGRTHQIRVHLEAVNHPLVGDSLYGGEKLINRHFLHATSLQLKAPTSGEKLLFNSPLPPDLQALLDRLT